MICARLRLASRALIGHSALVGGADDPTAGTIRLNLRDAIPLYNRGLARRATGDVDGAIADYEFGARLAAPHDEMFRKRLDELQTHRGP